jgi:hypothetical protein
MRDVDQIIQRIKNICPDADIQQLQVLHPGNDDDGIWFFTQPGSEFEVQIESGNGMCPFLIETDENASRLYAHSVEETVGILTKLLHLESVD